MNKQIFTSVDIAVDYLTAGGCNTTAMIEAWASDPAEWEKIVEEYILEWVFPYVYQAESQAEEDGDDAPEHPTHALCRDHLELAVASLTRPAPEAV